MHLYLRALRRWMHMLRCWRHHMRSKMVLAASDQWNHGFLRMWRDEVGAPTLCDNWWMGANLCGIMSGQPLVAGFPRWNFQEIVEQSICKPLSWSLQPNARFAHRDSAKHQTEPDWPMELRLNKLVPNDWLKMSYISGGNHQQLANSSNKYTLIQSIGKIHIMSYLRPSYYHQLLVLVQWLSSWGSKRTT